MTEVSTLMKQIKKDRGIKPAILKVLILRKYYPARGRTEQRRRKRTAKTLRVAGRGLSCLRRKA
jgi:hypothetical protein